MKPWAYAGIAAAIVVAGVVFLRRRPVNVAATLSLGDHFLASVTPQTAALASSGLAPPTFTAPVRMVATDLSAMPDVLVAAVEDPQADASVQGELLALRPIAVIAKEST